MKRLIAMTVLLAAAAQASAQAPATADVKVDPAAQKVLECMRGNVPAAVLVQDFELISTDHRGENTTLSGKLYAQREVREGKDSFTHAMLRVEQPDHLKGAAYLVRQTDDYLRDGMYVYLPSVRRVRRVTGTFADGSLLGTSFSYYDFKQLANAFGDLNAKAEARESIGTRPVHVLSFSTMTGAETLYNGARAWIDTESCLPLKVEFLENGKPRKRLTAKPDAIRPNGKHWYLSQSEVVDLKDNSRTILRVTNLTSGQKLPTRYFNPNTFYVGN